MENGEKDFMKNRPPASYANQVKDVYSPTKKDTRKTITILFTVVLVILCILSLIASKAFLLILFIPLLIALWFSYFFAKKVEKDSRPVEKKDHPDAIFKEHDID